MADTGYSRSPKLSKGAIVQLTDELVVPVPSIIPFQYNPELVRRSINPCNPTIAKMAEDKECQLPAVDPIVQPFDPRQTISITIELDAVDQLEDDDPVAKLVGIGDRIAALEQLLFPGNSPFGALINAASALLGAEPPVKPAVGITLLILGVGRIVPVRVTHYSIDEKHFLPSLEPLMAEVRLDMDVLTPDQFRKSEGTSIEIAKAAYRIFRTEQTALAAIQTVKNANQLLSILPF
jgi:hypothetical protein